MARVKVQIVEVRGEWEVDQRKMEHLLTIICLWRTVALPLLRQISESIHPLVNDVVFLIAPNPDERFYTYQFIYLVGYQLTC